MAKDNLSIIPYLHPTKVKDGKHQLFFRITYHRKKAELATKFFVAPNNWEYFRKKDNQFDEEQSKIKKELYRIKNRLEDEDKPVSAGIIKDIYIGKTKKQVYLLDYFDSFINRISTLTRAYTPDNVNKYRKTRDYITQFFKKVRKVKDLPISQIDYKFISDLDDYMITFYLPKLKRMLERNTVNQHHTRFKTILIRAIKEGIIISNPYIDFKLVDVIKPPKFLTNEELQSIAEHPLGDNLSLQRVRDIFIFSVYTGLRFSDAQQVKDKDIQRDNSGDYYLYIENQEKTDDPLMLPLFKPVIDIYKRYDNEERKITGFVLPRISNQKTNTYLKSIADLVGIKKKLTHHVARHTCATTILLNNGASMEATGKWLGQKSLKATLVYAKVTNQYLKQTAKYLEDKI